MVEINEVIIIHFEFNNLHYNTVNLPQSIQVQCHPHEVNEKSGKSAELPWQEFQDSVWSESVPALAVVSGPRWLNYQCGWFWIPIAGCSWWVGALLLACLGRLGDPANTACLPFTIYQSSLTVPSTSFPSLALLLRMLLFSCLKAQPITNCIASQILLAWGALLQDITWLLFLVFDFLSWVEFPRDSVQDRDSSACNSLGRELSGETDKGVKEAEWELRSGWSGVWSQRLVLLWS